MTTQTQQPPIVVPYVTTTVQGLTFRLAYADTADIAAFQQAANYLMMSPEGVSLLTEISTQGLNVPIVFNMPVQDEFMPLNGKNGSQPYISESLNVRTPVYDAIYWNPFETTEIFTPNKTPSDIPTASVGVTSAAINLIHEAAHATDSMLSANLEILMNYYDNLAEYNAVTEQNIVAGQLGEVIRPSHGHTGNINERNSTLNASGATGVWQEESPDDQALVRGGTYQVVPYPPLGKTSTSNNPPPDFVAFSGSNISGFNDTIDFSAGVNKSVTGNADTLYLNQIGGALVTVNLAPSNTNSTGTDKLFERHNMAGFRLARDLSDDRTINAVQSK